jgi:hypothetical protein
MTRNRVIGMLLMSIVLVPPAPSQVAAEEYTSAVKQLLSEAKENEALQLLTHRIAELDSIMVARALNGEELATYTNASLNLAHVWMTISDKESRLLVKESHQEKAAQTISKLLLVPSLRRTVPDATMPGPVHQLVEEVRKAKLGKFRVQTLAPPDAWVILGNDTLHAAPGDQFPSETDIIPGSYTLTIAGEGYRPFRDTIRIDAGATALGNYTLDPERNLWWWTWRGGVVAAPFIFGVVLVSLPSDEPTVPELPLPPGPPTR